MTKKLLTVLLPNLEKGLAQANISKKSLTIVEEGPFYSDHGWVHVKIEGQTFPATMQRAGQEDLCYLYLDPLEPWLVKNPGFTSIDDRGKSFIVKDCFKEVFEELETVNALRTIS